MPALAQHSTTTATMAVQPHQLPRQVAPFQLLELNIVSAQELCPVTRSMKTYAIVWTHPDRKLSTRLDPHGHANPTWNDKFVFRIDDEFLQNDTSAVMIEIYASSHWWRDVLVGTVRVLLGNLISKPNRWRHQLGMRFVALQVRRPSGRPQGILNIGVGLLDSSMRSMPLYSLLSNSAVGYRHLIDDNREEPYQRRQEVTQYTQNYHQHELPSLKPELRRTRSDTSSMIEPRNMHAAEGSMVSSDYTEVKGKKKGKASSWVSGSTMEIKQKAKGRKKKANSMISGSTAMENKKNEKTWTYLNINENPQQEIIGKPQLRREQSMKRVTIGDHVMVQKNIKKMSQPEKFERIVTSSPNITNEMQYNRAMKTKTNGKPNMRSATITPSPIHNNKFGNTKRNHVDQNMVNMGHCITNSELGPSPSEVVAQIALKEARMRQHKMVEPANSSVGGWSLDSSVEGLQSKLDRWRTELPVVHDRSECSSFIASEVTARPKSMHKRNLTEGDKGAFSCFSNICGLQCSIVCGSDSGKKGAKNRGRANSRVNDSVVDYM